MEDSQTRSIKLGLIELFLKRLKDCLFCKKNERIKLSLRAKMIDKSTLTQYKLIALFPPPRLTSHSQNVQRNISNCTGICKETLSNIGVL